MYVCVCVCVCVCVLTTTTGIEGHPGLLPPHLYTPRRVAQQTAPCVCVCVCVCVSSQGHSASLAAYLYTFRWMCALVCVCVCVCVICTLLQTHLRGLHSKPDLEQGLTPFIPQQPAILRVANLLCQGVRQFVSLAALEVDGLFTFFVAVLTQVDRHKRDAPRQRQVADSDPDLPSSIDGIETVVSCRACLARLDALTIFVIVAVVLPDRDLHQPVARPVEIMHLVL